MELRLVLFLSFVKFVIALPRMDNYYPSQITEKIISSPGISPIPKKFLPSPTPTHFVGNFDILSKKLSTNSLVNPSTIFPNAVKPMNNLRMERESNNFPQVALNSDANFEKKQNPSLAVSSFSEIQNEPAPMQFGFLPVFPWPEKMPKTIGHLFPKSGENEWGWRPPNVDSRLSVFPHPIPTRYDFAKFETTTIGPTSPPITTTTAKTTTEKGEDHVWNPSTWTRLPTFPTRITTEKPNFQVEFEVSTTTRSTTTKKMRTKPMPRSQMPIETQRNTRRIQNWAPKLVPRKTNRSFVIKEEKKINQNNQNFKSIPFQQKINKYKIFKCRALNPFVDAIPHPHTDKSCEQGFPGWQKYPTCRCSFLVANRNFMGCATKFHTLCWKI